MPADERDALDLPEQPRQGASRIARHPGARLRDIAQTVSITERRAHDIVTDLVTAGYVVKSKEGRSNRYTIQAHLPLPKGSGSNRTVGELLQLLAGTDDQR